MKVWNWDSERDSVIKLRKCQVGARSPMFLASVMPQRKHCSCSWQLFLKCVWLWACKVVTCRPYFLRGVWALPTWPSQGTPPDTNNFLYTLFQREACVTAPQWLACSPMSFHRPTVYKSLSLANCYWCFLCFTTNYNILHYSFTL